MSNSACIRPNEKNIHKTQKGVSCRLGYFIMEKSVKLKKKKIKNWGFYYVIFVLFLYLFFGIFHSKKLMYTIVTGFSNLVFLQSWHYILDK